LAVPHPRRLYWRIRNGAFFLAAVYASVSFVLGLLAVWCGSALAAVFR
jgi:fluoride ion exporter CrcB/FEX